MKNEIKIASCFLTKLLKSSGALTDETEISFESCLTENLTKRYENHWFPNEPYRGSAWRCLRYNKRCGDDVICDTAEKCGLSATTIYFSMPPEFTLWIDPEEVAFRIGEEGSVGVLYPPRKDEPATRRQPMTYPYMRHRRQHPKRGSPSSVESTSPRSISPPSNDPPAYCRYDSTVDTKMHSSLWENIEKITALASSGYAYA